MIKPHLIANMNNQPITIEAMPQNMARLEDKVDALTELVARLSALLSAGADKPPSEDFIGTETACEILHLSSSRIYALVQEGRIPFYKPGKSLLFLKSELLDWLKQSRRNGQQSIDEQMAAMTKGMRNSASRRWKL